MWLNSLFYECSVTNLFRKSKQSLMSFDFTDCYLHHTIYMIIITRIYLNAVLTHLSALVNFLFLLSSPCLCFRGLYIRNHSKWLKSVRLANDSIHYKLIVLLAIPIQFYSISFCPRSACRFPYVSLWRGCVVKVWSVLYSCDLLARVPCFELMNILKNNEKCT